MSFTINDSEPLTQEQADQIIADNPDSEVVYVHDDLVVWSDQVVRLSTPFQIISWLDMLGCPKPRVVLNMAVPSPEGEGKK